MKRAVVMVHKLTDSEVEELHCSHDFIKQEAAAEDMACDSGDPLAAVNIKNEVPDAVLEDITVKEEPIDWHQENQASLSAASSALTLKREVDNIGAEVHSEHAEAEDKLREGCSGACNTSAVRQKSAGASQGSADSLSSDGSVDAPISEDPSASVNIKSEVPGDELEDITVKEEPIDWHQEPQARMAAGGGRDFSTWRDLVLSYSGGISGVKNEKVAEVAKIVARDNWTVRDGRGVVAAARMLPHAQPRQLVAISSPHQLRGASWDVAPPREGAHKPWEEMVRLRKGELWLRLSDDTPCDDLLTPLHETRAQLVEFWGGIAEAASVAALSSAAAPASWLSVRLLAPLSLSALQGRCWWLRVLVRPLAATDGGPWPLPAQPRLALLVTDVLPGAWRDVVHTVRSFAPHDNRYGTLELHSCHLSEGDLDRTVAALQRRGISTGRGVGGPTCWARRDSNTETWFLLHITDELPERLAQLERDFLPAASCSPPVVPFVPYGRACCPLRNRP